MEVVEVGASAEGPGPQGRPGRRLEGRLEPRHGQLCSQAWELGLQGLGNEKPRLCEGTWGSAEKGGLWPCRGVWGGG